MAWIRVIDESQAEAELRAQYEDVRSRRGSISNVMKVHSLDPKAMKLHLDLYIHLMFGKSTLTRAQREMIAVVVSQANKCRYCVTHHGEALVTHANDHMLLEKIKTDFARAGITSEDKAILNYASKLTGTPGDIPESDIRDLRQAGFTDEAILRINLIASYFNFVNRIVSGLGVQIEKPQERVYKY